MLPSSLTPPPALRRLVVHLVEATCLLTVAATTTGLVLLRARASDDVPALDDHVRVWMLAHSGPLTAGAATISAISATLLVLAFSGVASVAGQLRWRDPARALMPVLSVLVADVAGAATKVLVARPRPGGAVAGVLETFAFPSGHTVSIAAFATGVLIAWRWTRPPSRAFWLAAGGAVTGVAIVMASRLVLDEHWLTDVLVGAAVGVGAAALVRWSVRAAFERPTVDLGEEAPRRAERHPART